ncbi:phosphoglycerate kinase [Terrihabitans soli]|uniref:Phosphoglycerate kinase n=1 Tax=Terrihabitans soli TaxID=708113 RepID=A0A6S6QQ33_9HYPH|nr:phosphoglycerate kinase [Terrihabitans soli]BCJ89865.1 phosphoglycerate kinase [Terrihabitans soli]
MTFKTLDEADLSGKRVLVRVDFNLPMEDGKVTDDTRIQAALPTINDITKAGGKAILIAHFGRPKGKRDETQSLKQIVSAVSSALGKPVAFADDCIGEVAEKAVAALKDGDVLLLENLRFHAGEEKDDPEFTKELAKLGDIFVNDAFSVAHRAAASVVGLAKILPSYAGRSMQQELEALGAALSHPERPVAAVVGGAKVSTKIELLGNLVGKVDTLIIGGGMANTFLAANGYAVGKSLCERDHLETAKEIQEKAKLAGCKIVLPTDAVVAKEFKANAAHRTVPADMVGPDEMILDAGPQSVIEVSKLLEVSKTLVWNGPFGAFELEPFDAATVAVAQKAAALTKSGKLLSVAGGGDTVAALNHAHAADEFSYISTAGGAFLEWLEGKPLPGVEALKAAR